MSLQARITKAGVYKGELSLRKRVAGGLADPAPGIVAPFGGLSHKRVLLITNCIYW